MNPLSPQPNIVLITTDQHRADCLGVEGHPVVKTPYLDQLATQGARFTHAYAACPQCIPARRTMLTGLSPEGHGVYQNSWMPLLDPTLPELLTGAGYQTHLVGKLHFWPQRKLYGFMSADWSDGPYGTLESSLGDYGLWLREQGFAQPERAAMDHGVSVNGWKARPWHLEERYHFTNWVTQKAQDFLDRRDPTVPFFLNVSYFHPHGPCTPPQAYWDQYISRDLPKPITAGWSTTQDRYEPGLPVDSWHTVLDEESMHRWRAGYFASITHIDDQIGVLLRALPANTIVIFTSDHGELLGDHQWIRKTRALEGSARIPFIVRFPEAMGVERAQVREEPIELMDVMPTCLEAAGVPVPGHVEGSSLLGLLRKADAGPREGAGTDATGGDAAWRQWVHGEMNRLGGANPPTGMQYLTDGRRKYVWEPGIARELFFDLESDPEERMNLADDPDRAGEIDLWRGRLVERLRHRPEGFVRDGRLVPAKGNTASFADRIIHAKDEWCVKMGIERNDLLG